MTRSSWAAPARRHGLFAVLLVLAALVRVAVVVAFPPGFVFSDGPTYLGLVDDLTPLTERTSGYGVLLHLLARVDRGVWLIVAVQHLMGLTTGVLAYVVMLRRGVSARVAALATAPVLFDAMELVVEHSVLSDVLFDLLLLAAVAALAWRDRPTPALAASAGLLLGLAVCVRVGGQPAIVLAALVCVAAVPGWRRRLATATALVVASLAPLAAYAAWYHHDHGVWALSESGGRALYMRTTTFVVCDEISVPSYERTLCPSAPVGERHDPTFYGWHDPDADHGLTPPAGITPGQAMHDFAVTAIRAQPGDYLRIVLRDVAANFDIARVDRFDYDTADKWTFDRYATLRTTDWTGPAYAAHGGTPPTARQPWADRLVTYGWLVYTPGPLLALLVVLAATGLIPGSRRRPPTRSTAATRSIPSRSLLVLVAGLGLGLMVLPDVTAEFVWRYQLPAVLLVPMAAALGWTRIADRLTRRRPEPGTAVSAPAAEAISPGRPRRPAPIGRTAG